MTKAIFLKLRTQVFSIAGEFGTMAENNEVDWRLNRVYGALSEMIDEVEAYGVDMGYLDSNFNVIDD